MRRKMGDIDVMSLERVLKALEDLGLSREESEVYVYLAKAGPKKVCELGAGLRMTKRQLYPVLKGLKNKGIVASRPERAQMFFAIAFEELLDLFMRIGAEKARAIQETRQELVSSWSETTKKRNS